MRTFLIVILVLWAVAFFGSFVVFYLTPADDFGFTRGANKVVAFGVVQLVAAVLAMMCLFLRWSTDDGALRRWAAIPAISLALMLSGFAGLYIWAGMQ